MAPRATPPSWAAAANHPGATPARFVFVVACAALLLLATGAALLALAAANPADTMVASRRALQAAPGSDAAPGSESAPGSTPAQPAPGSTPAQPAPGSTPSQPAPGSTPAEPAPGSTPAEPAPGSTSAEPAPGSTPAQPAPGSTPAQPAPGSTPAQPAPGSTPAQPAPGSTPAEPAPGSSPAPGSKPAPGGSNTPPNLDTYYDDDYMQDYSLEEVIAAASPSGSPPAGPLKAMKLASGIKFADVSKSFDVLYYLANAACKFPNGKTIFLPTNQAWSDALAGYKKTRSSGALYEALDAVASGNKVKDALDRAKSTAKTKDLATLAAKAKACNAKTTKAPPMSEAARTALLNLMSFHTAESKVTVVNLDNQCTPTGYAIKTAFNGNNLNFKCDTSNTGKISGADPLASGAAAGTSSAAAAIQEAQKDYFYVNALVFPSNIASLPGAVATVSRLFTSLLVIGAALACAL
ncbi:unnamed protein product [Closterium sp. Naga37s-1]|nr:unnamed protein product [Closterium sp. Naga37s-1]